MLRKGWSVKKRGGLVKVGSDRRGKGRGRGKGWGVAIKDKAWGWKKGRKSEQSKRECLRSY